LLGLRTLVVATLLVPGRRGSGSRCWSGCRDVGFGRWLELAFGCGPGFARWGLGGSVRIFGELGHGQTDPLRGQVRLVAIELGLDRVDVVHGQIARGSRRFRFTLRATGDGEDDEDGRCRESISEPRHGGETHEHPETLQGRGVGKQRAHTQVRCFFGVGSGASMVAVTPLPRWSLAALSGAFASLLLWAATALPWHAWTTFAIMTTLVGGLHAVTAVLAIAGHPRRALAWRVQAVAALIYAGYLTWNLLMSASYVAALYGGLGRGVAVALGLVWLIVLAIMVPLSVWGIAATGGVDWNRRSQAATFLVLALVGTGVVRSRNAAAAVPTPGSAIATEQVERTLSAAIAGAGSRRPVSAEGPSLMTAAPIGCDREALGSQVTIIATFVGDDAVARPQARSRCFSGTLESIAAELRDAIAKEAYAGPIALDLVTGIAPLRPVAPVVDSMALRPGLDGVCNDATCLMPWQLLALDAFRTYKPIPVIPELRFGFDPAFLHQALASERPRASAIARMDGLVRIETASFVTADDGTLHRHDRFRTGAVPLSRRTLESAVRSAEDYIADAQGEDGRFAYEVDPFVGQPKYRGFSLPRQAGTTLAMCELARDRPRTRRIATRALAMIERTGRKHGDLLAMHYPPGRTAHSARLGDTALSAIAFLSCRPLVGSRFDRTIHAMVEFLLTMQTANGSFAPTFDLDEGTSVAGPDPLYAVGQSIMALVLAEKLAIEHPGLGDPARIGAAVDAAMDYVSREYWARTFVSDFFFLEENWHCLAARAALEVHRHSAYEQFCLDYVQFKSRLILDPDSRVRDDLIGGYGFGNVLLPHNTATAGFGEAAAAAIRIAETRGEDLPKVRDQLQWALQYLLRQQWTELTCFACAPSYSVVGGFSEHPGSMAIRIDYVQHAMAALGHGGAALGWFL